MKRVLLSLKIEFTIKGIENRKEELKEPEASREQIQAIADKAKPFLDKLELLKSSLWMVK